MMLRLIGAQGIAGIAVAIVLALLLTIQKAETRRWRGQSGRYEQLYHASERALAETVANYRAAAERARAADQAAADQVRRQQATINQRSQDDLQARLFAARAHAERLRASPSHAAADPGGRRAAPVPGVPAGAGRAAEAARDNGLSDDPSTELGAGDALIATEQAIQLDELIKWVQRQQAVRAERARP
jgi:hypothetical protein